MKRRKPCGQIQDCSEPKQVIPRSWVSSLLTPASQLLLLLCTASHSAMGLPPPLPFPSQPTTLPLGPAGLAVSILVRYTIVYFSVSSDVVAFVSQMRALCHVHALPRSQGTNLGTGRGAFF